MEFRVIDFEILTTHYKNYRDGVDVINAERENILKVIEPIKKEMNQIISSATTFFVGLAFTLPSDTAKSSTLMPFCLAIISFNSFNGIEV